VFALCVENNATLKVDVIWLLHFVRLSGII
jgi:hypothetical protein